MASTRRILIWIILLFGINIHVIKGQEYDYLNCYYDFYNSRILKDLTDCSDTSLCDCSIDAPFCEHGGMTIAFCENLCRRKNYKYFGLQAGKQCFCGGGFSNTGQWYLADTAGAVQRCATPCVGNPNEECGGDYLMKVFRFKDPLGNSVCFHPGAPDSIDVNQQELTDYFFDVEEIIQYTCVQRGQKVIGVSQIECHNTGQWTNTPPSGCQPGAAECSIPPIPQDAFQSSGFSPPDGIYYEGDTVKFICSTDFSDFSISCTPTGAWTDPGNPCVITTTNPTTTTTTTVPTTRRTTTTKEPTTPTAPPVTAPQCPNINCGFLCPYGFQRDHRGCYVCQCISPPINPTTAKPATTTPTQPVCLPITCKNNCPYGLRVDINGCTTCECIPPLSTTKLPMTETSVQSTSKPADTEVPKGNTRVSVTIASQPDAMDYLPYIFGGLALMGIILIVVLAINCRQSKKHKGPAPPPPDYPTIDGIHHRHRKDSVYDEITVNKGKKKRKNSYVQNDIPNPPPPPTVSQNIPHQQFSNIHSLDRSMVGTTHYPHSQSLSKSSAGSLHRPTSRNQSRSALGLDRSVAGGYPTPNSRSLSTSMPRSKSRSSRFIPIDHSYANTLNRSVASDPQGRVSHSRPSLHTRSAGSNPSTPRSLRKSRANGSHTPTSHHKSMPNGLNAPIYQNKPMANRSQTPDSPHTSVHSDPHSYRTYSNMSLNTIPNTPTISHHENKPSAFVRSRSLYGNLPPVPTGDQAGNRLTAHGSLDQMSKAVEEEQLYMEPIEYNSADRPRPPHRSPSTELSQISGIQQQQQQQQQRHMSGKHSGRGPRLNVNCSSTTRSIERYPVPPDSPFGNNKLELTTPL